VTAQELADEYRYRVDERLGILCGSATPTKEQMQIAHREAMEAIKKLKLRADRAAGR
jgi:hypothetical protein